MQGPTSRAGPTLSKVGSGSAEGAGRPSEDDAEAAEDEDESAAGLPLEAACVETAVVAGG